MLTIVLGAAVFVAFAMTLVAPFDFSKPPKD
jgi:hypothetical protein